MNVLGDRIIEITAVDVRQNELMNAWLVYATVQCANIAKSYQIMLPIGSNESSIIKVWRIAFVCRLFEPDKSIYYC